jgi:hypothetical protein
MLSYAFARGAASEIIKSLKQDDKGIEVGDKVGRYEEA